MRPTIFLFLACLSACASKQPAATEEPAPAEQAETAHDPSHSHGDHKGPMHHRFDDAEKWAKVFDDPARDAWQKPDEVVAAMNLTDGMVVADIGAGTGYFLGRLSQAVVPTGRVEGLDVEQSMVDYMNERAAKQGWENVTARVIPMDGPGLEPDSVDRILIVDTWHHIGARADYAKKLATALKADGAVYIVDFDVDSRRGPPAKHKLAPETVIAELVAGGLAAETIEESLPDQYIIVARPN